MERVVVAAEPGGEAPQAALLKVLDDGALEDVVADVEGFAFARQHSFDEPVVREAAFARARGDLFGQLRRA